MIGSWHTLHLPIGPGPMPCGPGGLIPGPIGGRIPGPPGGLAGPGIPWGPPGRGIGRGPRMFCKNVKFNFWIYWLWDYGIFYHSWLYILTKTEKDENHSKPWFLSFSYCKSLYIREGLYFANICEQVHLRIQNYRESLFWHCYHIICLNQSV